MNRELLDKAWEAMKNNPYERTHGLDIFAKTVPPIIKDDYNRRISFMLGFRMGREYARLEREE